MSKGFRSAKRSGRDIKAVVGSYLRRRHYIDSSETFKVSELVTKQSPEQMSFDAAVEKDSSCLNSILYRNQSTELWQAEEQLIKLWSWISEMKDSRCKSEITIMLLPLFLHLYLDLFHYGKRLSVSPTIIEEFLMHYHNKDNNANAIIQVLPEISSIQDVEKYEIIKSFRSCKFQLKLSSTTFNNLNKFLEKNAFMVLLGVLQKWFEVDVYVEGTSIQEDDDCSFIRQNVLKLLAYNKIFMKSEPLIVLKPSSSTFVPNAFVKDTDLKQLQESIRIVRETPSRPTPVLVYTLNNTENICCSSVSRTYKLLATGTLASEVKLWNLQETKLPPIKIRHIPLGCDPDPLTYNQQESRYCTLRGHTGPVYDTKFVPKSEVVLSVSHDTDMRAWNLNDFSCASVYSGHTYPIWSVSASSLGLHIATGSQDRTARLWNLERCFPLRIFSGHLQDVNCVQFHPNNAYFASASYDKTVRMWDIVSSNMVRVFVGHSGGVHTLAFSPRGNLLASAGDGGRVKIWDIAAGKLFADLKGHTGRVIAIDWSNDASTVASLSCDGTVLSWKVDKLNQMMKSSVGSSTNHLSDLNVRDSNLSEVTVLEQPFRCSTGFSTALSLEYSLRNTCIVVGTK